MTIRIETEKNTDRSVNDLVNLINTKVKTENFCYKTTNDTIYFSPNSNVNQHTLLIGLLILFSKSHYERHCFYVSFCENIGGRLCNLDSENIQVIYQFIESIDLNNIDIEIN